MRVLMVLALGLCLFAAGPADARQDDEARRLALAERYLQVTQGPSLRKTIQGFFEDTFAKAGAPTDEREWLSANMSAAFDVAIQATFAELTDDVAEIFTVQELEALIVFFDTPLGRSVSDKSFELGIRTQAVMAPHLIAAMTQLGEKYCARFECSDAEGAQTGKPAE